MIGLRMTSDPISFIQGLGLDEANIAPVCTGTDIKDYHVSCIKNQWS